MSARNLKFSYLLATTTRCEKNFYPPEKKRKVVVGGGVYMMENKDTNRDYQEVVRVGDQKREIVEIRIGITFLFEICIHYFLFRDFFFLHLITQ